MHSTLSAESAAQAAQLPKASMDRLLLIAAFAQSGFATGLRPFRNLNAAMGETLEVCKLLTPAQRCPCFMLCAGAKHCSSPMYLSIIGLLLTCLHAALLAAASQVYLVFAHSDWCFLVHSMPSQLQILPLDAERAS